jgi:hypothetical protein
MWAPRISWVSWWTTSFSAPLGSPRIAARALDAKIGRGGRHAPAGGRGLLGGQAHGGKRRPGVYRPRQALAADLSGSPERVAAGHGPRRHRPVGQPGWAGHVAGGVDAGRGGALLLVDGDAAVVPKPHAGVVQAELFHVGQAGVGADHRLDVDGPNRALREP